MDQGPQAPQQINPEGILAWLLGVGATLTALFVRSKIRVGAMRAKAKAESEPRIESEYLEANEKITTAWQQEVVALRAQIDKVRDEGRTEAQREREVSRGWMERAMRSESRVPALEAEIVLLKERVRSLEEQLGERAAPKGTAQPS